LKFEHQYQIPFVGLKQGLHRFTFEVNDEFFANFEGATINGSDIKVDIDFDKKSDFFILKFYISGIMNADCDRCALVYQQEILDEFTIYVKFDDRNLDIESEDEDVLFISRADTHLDVAQLIYDFVNLSVPMQLICAKNRNTDESCNPELSKFLTTETENKEEEIDQRWSALKKLKK
jgi:uncharacterized metal-binding protein YceD (DUF177 family)